jgi:Sulfotransferase domain
MNKLIRRILLALLSFLPVEQRAAVSSWMRGRNELKKLERADYVFVTCPKSGRTWLRIMLSRILQKRHDLPETAIVGSSSFNRNYPKLPSIIFTHDTYLSSYTGNKTDKRDYYGKRIVLLVRDPRDVAVSAYFQWKYRMDAQKKATHATFFEDTDLSVFDFTVHPQGSLRKTIELMNSWHEAMPNAGDLMVVRYEDLRSDPNAWLERIATFIDLHPTPDEIRDAVEYSSLENMKKMEREKTFGTTGRRFGASGQDSSDAYKVRRGKVGGYRDYYTDEELEVVNEIVSGTLSPGYGYT